LEAAKVEGQYWERVRNVALLLTLRDTGGRIGGVLNVTIDNLDLDLGIADTIEKGGRPGYLFLNEASKQAIREWLPMRWELNPADEFVFIGLHGKRLSRTGVYHILDRLSSIAGVENLRHNPHAFRHAFARDAMDSGADINQVSQMMNHSSVYITAKYYGRYTRRALKQIHAKTSPGAKVHPVELETFGEV
jgi:site-specific recombinase XerD